MAEDLSALNKSISELNKNLKYLTGANLFNNARMNEMVEASTKIKDNFEDIDEYTNDTVKKLKEEETRLKANNALKKKELDIKKLEREIEEKTAKIRKNGLELAERNRKIINKLNKEEIDRTDELKQQTLKLADQRKELGLQLEEARANLKTARESTKEFEKQLDIQKEQKGLLSSLGSDLKRLGGNLKNLASGTIGKFLSAGMFVEGWKNLYEMSNKVYDSYWGLSVPLQKANTGMWALKNKTEEYSKALRDVKLTAAKFGYDIDKIAPMMDTLQDKVKYLKKDTETGIFEWDIERLSDNAKQIIAISKKMNMESDEMITMLEERVRRFGDTNEAALNSMNAMASATLTFNEIMGQGSVFTEEVGKHLLELHQNTKYWVQDFGMLNTMFNSHVTLLLKQGKHQKEALALARQFQEGLQQPPDLIKWKAGSKMLANIRKEIKGLDDEQAEEKIKKLYGKNVDAATIVKAIRHGGNTGYTLANILQEMLGGTVKGTEATMGAWGSFMGFDSTVLKDMGLASSVSDAEKIKQLYKDLSRMNLNASTSMEEAIDKMVDIDKNLSDEEKKAKKEELKGLLNANKGVADEEPQSPFENEVLSTMKSLKAWLDTPMVQIAAGAVAGGGSIFKDTLSNIFSMVASSLIVQKGGAAIKSVGGKIKGVGAGGWKTITSTPLENFHRLKGSISGAITRNRYDKAIGKMLSSNMIDGEYLGDMMAKPAKSKQLWSSLTKKRTLPLGKFRASTGGGLAAIGIGALAGFLTDENDQREGLTVNNAARSVSGIASGLAMLNPIGFGVSTLINLVNNENKGLDALTGAVGVTLLSPVNDIVTGVGKIFGQNEKNNRLLSFTNDAIRVLSGTMQKNLPKISEEAKERLKRQAAQKTENVLGTDRYISKVLGADIGSFSASQLKKLIEEGDTLLRRAESGEIKMDDKDYLLASEQLDKLRPALGMKEAQEFVASNFDITKYGMAGGLGLIQKNYAKNLGLSGDILSNKDFFIEKLMSHGRSKEQAENQFKAMVASYGSARVMNEEGLMTKMTDVGMLNAITKDFMEMLDKEDLEAMKQNKILEDQKQIEQQMQNDTKSMLENSNTELKYLNTIRQKAALDIIKDANDYSGAIAKLGKLKYQQGSWTIEGVDSTVAQTIGSTFMS